MRTKGLAKLGLCVTLNKHVHTLSPQHLPTYVVPTTYGLYPSRSKSKVIPMKSGAS